MSDEVMSNVITLLMTSGGILFLFVVLNLTLMMMPGKTARYRPERTRATLVPTSGVYSNGQPIRVERKLTQSEIRDLRIAELERDLAEPLDAVILRAEMRAMSIDPCMCVIDASGTVSTRAHVCTKCRREEA